MNLERAFLPPPNALLGFDAFGQPLMDRLLTAIAYSGLLSATLTIGVILIGGFAGILLTLLPERPRQFALQINHAFLAFPGILLCLLIASVAPRTPLALGLTLFAAFLPARIRQAYGLAMRYRGALFIEASRSIGATSLRLALRHIGPLTFSATLTQAPALWAQIILTEASLGFLGLGAPTRVFQTPSLGQILLDGRQYYLEAPYLLWIPAATFVLILYSLNLVAEKLRRSYNKKL